MMGYLWTIVLLTLVAIATQNPSAHPHPVPSVCGGRLTGDSGTFTSPPDPDQPQLYLKNVTCTWHIGVPFVSHLNITFTKFSTEGCCDFVKLITKEGKQIAQFNGIRTNDLPAPIVLTREDTSELSIIFYSDTTVAKEGFEAHYKIKRNTVMTTPTPVPTTERLDGLSIVSAFQILTTTLTRIMLSGAKTLGSPPYPRRKHLIQSLTVFKTDLSAALAQLAKLRSVSSAKLSPDEQKQINFALKHLNLRAKQHRLVLSKNTPPGVCKLPKKTGPCRAYNLNWYFDLKSFHCRKFVYGGCQGNGNNFASKHECEALCKIVPKTDPTTRTVPATNPDMSTTMAATTAAPTTGIPTMCPPGVFVWKCFANPCVIDTCDAYQMTTCQANYCGKCSAQFYDLHGNRIPRSACRCRVQPAACLLDPCQYTLCAKYPLAKCRARICGACKAEFVDNKGKVITDC